MSIKRRILFYTFVIIFLILAPLISLYSIGYRLNGKFKIWQLTGKLTIISKPDGAMVYINGKPQRKLINKFFLKKEYLTTPVKIDNLLPGKYNLKLKKNGYITWQKKINIKSGINTVIKNVQLFKNSLPLLLKSGKYSHISFLNNKKIIISNSNKIDILNIENNQIKTLAKTNSIVSRHILSNAYPLLTEKINDYSLSANNQYIIIFSKKNNYIIKLTNFSKFKKLTAFKKRNFCWDLVKNNIFYYKKDNKIYQLSINNNFLITSRQIKIKNNNAQIINFLAKNNNLYIIVKKKNNLKLIQYDISLPQIKQKKAIELPFCNSYQLILYNKDSENNLINIYNPSYQMLNLIDLNRIFFPPIRKTINNIKYFKWIDKNNMLYNNDYEIWIYNLKNNNQILITRDSNIIEKSILYPLKNYIIYNTKNSLKIIELVDNEEKRNIEKLCKFDKIYSPLLSNDGNKIYFLGSIGKEDGLYELNIK